MSIENNIIERLVVAEREPGIDRHRFLIKGETLVLVQEPFDRFGNAMTPNHDELATKMVENEIFDKTEDTVFGGYCMVKAGNKLSFYGPAGHVKSATSEQFDKALESGNIVLVDTQGKIVAK